MLPFQLFTFKIWSRSRSTIFAILLFDGEYRNLQTSFFIFLIFAKMRPVVTKVTDRRTDGQTDGRKDGQTDRQQTGRQKDSQRQTDRQRQTYRQTDTQPHRETDKVCVTYNARSVCKKPSFTALFHL